MSSSQIFTIGTALRRAEDNSVPVEVLVEGQWLRGEIAGLDGDGLVLVTPERTQCVVRNAHISVVRILANLSFDDEAPSEPRATTYESAGTTYDAPPDWEPAGTADAGTAATAAASSPSGDDASTFRWASTHGSAPAAESGPVVSDLDEDRVVLGTTGDDERVLGAGAHDDVLVLGAAVDDDLLVLDAGDDGPLELGSGSSWQDADVAAHETVLEPATTVAEQPAETPVETPLADEPSSDQAPEAPEAEVIQLQPEPPAAVEVAEPVAQEPPVAKEAPDDLVSRLLAESMREAGIEPEQPAVAEATPEPAPVADTAVDAAGDAAPSELLHPEKAEANDDEPRIFALPAPSAVAAETTPATTPPAAPAAPEAPAATAAPVTPAPAAAPAPEPTPQPAAESPAPAAPAAAAGDDWRSMLEGLRGEASTPQTTQSASAGQAEEKRRGRRLVMR